MNLLFANCLHFSETLQVIEHMPETTFDEIMDKCIEMNVEVCGIEFAISGKLYIFAGLK